MADDEGWLDDVFFAPVVFPVTPPPGFTVVPTPVDVTASLSGSAAGRLLDEGVKLLYGRRPEEALPKLRRAGSMVRTEHGPNSPVVAWILNHVGLALDAMHRHHEAEAAHRQALAIREETLDAADPVIAVSLHNLGINLGLQGRADESVLLFSRAVEIEAKAYGPDSPHTFATRVDFVERLADAGRSGDAIRELKKLRTVFKRHGENLVGLGDILERVHELAGRLGA